MVSEVTITNFLWIKKTSELNNTTSVCTIVQFINELIKNTPSIKLRVSVILNKLVFCTEITNFVLLCYDQNRSLQSPWIYKQSWKKKEMKTRKYLNYGLKDFHRINDTYNEHPFNVRNNIIFELRNTFAR